jgi:nucleoside phosphorylase
MQTNRAALPRLQFKLDRDARWIGSAISWLQRELPSNLDAYSSALQKHGSFQAREYVAPKLDALKQLVHTLQQPDYQTIARWILSSETPTSAATVLVITGRLNLEHTFVDLHQRLSELRDLESLIYGAAYPQYQGHISSITKVLLGEIQIGYDALLRVAQSEIPAPELRKRILTLAESLARQDRTRFHSIPALADQLDLLDHEQVTRAVDHLVAKSYLEQDTERTPQVHPGVRITYLGTEALENDAQRSPAAAAPTAPPATAYAMHASELRPAREVIPIPNPNVLLITATTVESSAVIEACQNWGGASGPDREYPVEAFPEVVVIRLPVIHGTTIFLTQCEMGSTGASGAILTASAAIRTLRPVAVIMLGIAFGVDEKKQTIGNVLVANQIQDYELQRIGTDDQGQPKVLPRGDRASASPHLLQRFRLAVPSWHGQTQPTFGLLLSGQKLLDNIAFRDALTGLWPEAIGGEMEGAGLYAAASRDKVDWIVAKAICDFADGNKQVDKQARQQLAARNAADFVMHVLHSADFLPRD